MEIFFSSNTWTNYLLQKFNNILSLLPLHLVIMCWSFAFVDFVVGWFWQVTGCARYLVILRPYKMREVQKQTHCSSESSSGCFYRRCTQNWHWDLNFKLEPIVNCLSNCFSDWKYPVIVFYLEDCMLNCVYPREFSSYRLYHNHPTVDQIPIQRHSISADMITVCS